MTLIKRTIGASGAAVLLAATLSACGGGPPTDASKEDYCGEIVNAEIPQDELTAESTPAEQAEVYKQYLEDTAEKAEEVGTPEDIPDDAREGFELTIEIANDLDEDDIEKAIEEEDAEFLEDGLSDDDKEKLDAYDEWSSEYCA